METFGAFIKRLRSARRLSQQELATRASASMATIRRAEQSAAKLSEWRKSTATGILTALESVAPLSDADRATYLRLTLLEGVAALGRQMLADMDRETKHVVGEVAKSGYAYSTQGDPDRTTVHSWVERMMEEAGPVRVISALEALAAAWSLDLPPRIKRDDPRARGYWVHSTGVVDMGGGVRGEILTPVPLPSRSPPPKAQPRRRPA